MAPKQPAQLAPQSSNHQLISIKSLLEQQCRAAAAIQDTDNPTIKTGLKSDMLKRNSSIANELQDFLHDPFTHHPISDFTNDQKSALKRLRAAWVDVLNQPSETSNSELIKANVSLVLLLRPEAMDINKGIETWAPEKYETVPAMNQQTNCKPRL